MKILKLVIVLLISATTYLNSQNVIFEENFDTLAYGTIPNGWTQYIMGDTISSSWKGSYGGINSTMCLSHGYHTANIIVGDNWIVTPQIILNDNYILSFWDKIRQYSSGYALGYSSVLISTGSPDPADSNYVEIFPFDTTILDTWINHDIDLSTYNGSSVYIAFKYVGQKMAHRWSIDDISVGSIAVDGGVSQIIYPTGTVFPGGVEDVIVKLENYGNVPLVDANINWSVNGVNQTPFDTLGLNLATNSSIDINLGQFDFSTTGIYTIVASSVINGDTVLSNDTAYSIYNVLPTIDFAITNINPTGAYSLIGNVDVVATIKNVGTSLANNCTIDWYVDNIQQTPYQGLLLNLLPGDSMDIILGNYNFVAGYHNIDAEITNANDIDPSNDTMSVLTIIGEIFESFEGDVFPPEGWTTFYSTREWMMGAYDGSFYYSGMSAVNMFGTVYDTLFTPLLDIDAGDTISFALRLNDFFPTNFELIWKDGTSGQINQLQSVLSPGVPWTTHSIDLTNAAGTNYLGFVITTAGVHGPAEIDYIRSNATIHLHDSDLVVRNVVVEEVARININDTIRCTVKNHGTNSVQTGDYSVKLMQAPNTILTTLNGNLIDPMQELVYEFVHTFTSIDDNPLYIEIDYTGDMNPVDNVTDTFHVYTVPQTCIDNNVGQPNVTSLNLPFNAMGSDMSMGEDDISQVLYMKSELKAGYIYGYTLYYYNPIERYHDLPLQIMISETTLTDLSGGWIPYNDFVLVYDGVMEVKPGINSFYISFDYPYLYTGLNNIVVQSYQYDMEWPGTNTSFYVNGIAPEVRTIRLFDVYALDPTNPPAGPLQLNDYPYTTFVIDSITQSSIISGHVYDNIGSTIANAKVSIDGTVVSVTTLPDGSYLLPSLPYDTYQITAKALGFMDSTQTLVVDQANHTLDFYLNPRPEIVINGHVVGSDAPSVPLENVLVELNGYSMYNTTTNASGDFLFNSVFGYAEYIITLSKYGYHNYVDTLTLTDQDINLGTIILQEEFISAFNVEATDIGTEAIIKWNSPADGIKSQLINDYNSNDYSYTNSPDENVWLGNIFIINELTTITSVEVQWDIYDLTSDYLTIDIFDEDQNLLVQSKPFLTAKDSLMTIEIPNITVNSNIYAMVHWKDNPQSTNALIIDYTVNIPNTACIKYPGDSIFLMTDYIPGAWAGSFHVRVNTLEVNTTKQKSVLSYNIYRDFFNDIDNIGSWPAINLSPIFDTVFLDIGWPPSAADTFVYVVEAIYTAGIAERTISNKLVGTTVGINEILVDEISVYPNPATDVINIIKAGDAIVELYNNFGQLLHRREHNSGDITIDVSSYVPGNYLLKIIRANKMITKRVQIL